jgi:hypothetical protein
LSVLFVIIVILFHFPLGFDGATADRNFPFCHFKLKDPSFVLVFED